MEIRITFGPPGTGKTTAMLDRVNQHLEAGIPPGRIAFVSYTRKAVIEAVMRASDKFDLNPKEFRHFRTMHSTAYQALGIQKQEVMQKEDYDTVGKLLGLRFSGRRVASDGLGASEETGDYMLQVINLSNATREPLRQVWEGTDRNLDWFRLKQLADTLIAYKIDMCKVDFDDMLSHTIKERPVLGVDAVVIDEAQDLSNAQWDMAKAVFRGAKYLDIAGDDDQAIYGWSGANVERFLNIKGDTRVLNQSYRLPSSIHRLSQQIIRQVGHRKAKEWNPKDEEGTVNHVMDPSQVDLTTGNWLLLARNGYMLEEYKEECESQGVSYILNDKSSIKEGDVRAIVLWGRYCKDEILPDEDREHLMRYTTQMDPALLWYDALDKIPVGRREYYLSILRKGGRLQDPPRIVISTIHGVKGGEADNVLLGTDVSARTFDSMQRVPDNEHRVFYVGATRARKNLFILQNRTDRGYPI